MSNYATDVFAPIFEAIQSISGARPYTDKVGEEDSDGIDMAYRVVADHIRTLSFAIADGAQPGNEGRNYVLRRILRRAVRYGQDKLKAPEGFLASLVDVVVTKMGSIFPELVSARNTIHGSISVEEKNFGRTLKKGLDRFTKLADAAQEQKSSRIDGAAAFQLWDVFGFPPDLTQLMAEERHLQVDMEGFNQNMEQQRSRSRAAASSNAAAGLKFEAAATSHLQKTGVPRTNDKPKFARDDVETELLAIFTSDGFVDEAVEAQASSTMGLILRDTSYYSEMGGQVGDSGSIRNDDATGNFTVADTKAAAGYVLHIGTLDGSLKVGDKVHAAIDHERRDKIMSNHTSTHVLNHALRELLGEHINQSGSAVDEDRLRFDFTHPKKLEPQEVFSIESACQKGLRARLPVFSEEVPQEAARQINGVRWLQDEKYPDPVRVVSIGVPVQQLLSDPENTSYRQYSIEFCGGTHLENTARAVGFVLVSEESSATGIRRVTALTGDKALLALREGQELSSRFAAAKSLKAAELDKEITLLKQTLDQVTLSADTKHRLRGEMAKLVQQLLDEQKKAASASKEQASQAALDAVQEAAAAGRKFAVVQINVGLAPKACQDAWAEVQKQHSDVAVLFISPDAVKKKALVWAAVPDSLLKAFPSQDWAKAALTELGGKGGGKGSVAQGQGTQIEKVPQAIEAATKLAQMKLA
ncbi:hypothetical protein WJX84_012264 [Apatococcus fuscideae]